MPHCLRDGSLKQQRFRRILRFGLEVPGGDMLFAIRHQYGAAWSSLGFFICMGYAGCCFKIIRNSNGAITIPVGGLPSELRATL